MRFLAAVLALAVAGCGTKKEPPKAPETGRTGPGAGIKEAPKSDPGGTYTCLKCGVKLKDPKCRYCGEVLKSEGGGTSGNGSGHSKSALSPTYACPKEGCKFTSGRKEKCLSHADTDLKAQWFVCRTCDAKEVRAGACTKCKKDLVRELREE